MAVTGAATPANRVITPNMLLQEEYLLHDVGSERAFLACLMKRPDLMNEAERQVSPEDLYYDRNQYIYRIMLWIYQTFPRNGWSVNFDPLTMLNAARSCGPQFEQQFYHRTEGMEQVRQIELMKSHVRGDQFGQYVALVRDRSHRIGMYRQARRIQEQCLDISKHPQADAIAAGAESFYSQTSMACQGMNGDGGRLMQISEVGQSMLAKAALNFDHKNLFRVPVPSFSFLMQLLNGGFLRTGLTILTARYKVGKSTLMLYWAMEAALCGIPVLYLDTEMTAEEMYSRGLSNVSEVEENFILAGKFVDGQFAGDFDRIVAAVQKLATAPFYYVRVAGKHPEQLVSYMRQFRNQCVGTREYTYQGQRYTFSNPALVIYDWLKLPDPGSLQQAKEYQALGFIASTIKDAAAQLDLAVIAGAQNNRDAAKLDGHQWGELGDATVSGSDRLAMFCSAMLQLRNVSNEEKDLIRAKLPKVEQGKAEDDSDLYFNQILYLQLQRQGRAYRDGIPLRFQRGVARYQEMADKDKSSDVAALALVKEFSRQRKSRGKNTVFLQSQGTPKVPAVGGPATVSDSCSKGLQIV